MNSNAFSCRLREAKADEREGKGNKRNFLGKFKKKKKKSAVAKVDA